MQLNLKKSELIVPYGQLSDTARACSPAQLLVDQATGDDRVNLAGDFEVLGGPIGTAANCSSTLGGKLDTAKKTLDAVAKLEDPQGGYRLLKNFAGFCKMVYSMRTVAPMANTEPLASFDQAVRETFAELLDFSPSNDERGQAQLGLR